MCRHQGIGTFGTEGAAFGFSNIDQQLTGRLSTSATLNPFPAAGGNPFGWSRVFKPRLSFQAKHQFVAPCTNMVEVVCTIL